MLKLGHWGEEKAAEFLREKGCEIIGLNYRTRFGETDIIACDGEFIIFAEVKLRKNKNFAAGREFVDYKKQRKLKMCAEAWLAENSTGLQPRMDIIEIYAAEGVNSKSISIEHIEDAF